MVSRFLIRLRTFRIFSLLLVVTLTAPVAVGQQVILSEEAYLQPPSPILESVTAPWHENVSLTNLSPDGTKFLITKSAAFADLSQLARPYVNLGEQSIDHIALRSRRLSTGTGHGFQVFHFADDRYVDMEVPEGIHVAGPQWSPDGASFAFMGLADDGTYLYLADCETGKVRQLTNRRLLATNVTTFDWTQNGAQIAAVLEAEGHTISEAPPVATEPTVRVSRNGKTPTRTYRFLLQTPLDAARLQELSTGQLAMIDVAGGQVTTIGEPDMYLNVDASPKGDFVRVTRRLTPFSYFVPASRFGRRDDVIDLNGESLQMFSETKLDDGTQDQDGDDGDDDKEEDEEAPKRDIRWRPDGRGFSFLQLEPKPEQEEKDGDDADADSDGDDADDDDSSAADGEDDEKKEEPKRKDRVMVWRPPFGDDNVEVVYESEEPIQQVRYSPDCKTIFVTQTIEKKRTIFAIFLNKPDEKLVVFQAEQEEEANGEDAGRGGRGGRGGAPAARGRGGRGGRVANRSQDDTPKGDDKDEEEQRGAKEGSLMTRTTASGEQVVRISSDGAVYFSGNVEAEDEDDSEDQHPPKPFIDKVDIRSGEVTRLYEGDGKHLERISGVNGDQIAMIFLQKEDRHIVPDSYVHELESKETRKLTNNKNYAPWYTKLETERFQVTRVDGFKFWVRVYRNPDYGRNLPAMFWFYPREYNDQETYDRGADRFDSPQVTRRFARPSSRSMTHLTQIGYLVVEPDLPIVGPDGRWNDNFVPDLRNGLWAVINELNKRDLIDIDRLALGGHSYGAFGTANALAHTPFFRAGIAGDGNFNRTLTPMAFQRERRYLWDARETYFQMSPLFWANQVNGALLMYHGAEDPNTGTFPIHSERMFQALDGLGKPTSMYMYPYEGHGPIARETILDLWARWVEWLDRHVKHPQSEDDEEEED